MTWLEGIETCWFCRLCQRDVYFPVCIGNGDKDVQYGVEDLFSLALQQI